VASYFSLRRHDNYLSTFDLANFDQALWLLAQGEEPFITQHGRHLMGDHFNPALVLLVPIYVLGGGVGALLVLQSVLVALVAPLLYVLARIRGATEWIAAVPAVLWLASPLTLTQNLDDFHHTPIAAPLIVGSIVALQRDRLVLFAALGLVACSFKEDIPLIYAMLGVIVILEGPRRLGFAIVAVATTVFAFAVFVFMPHYGNSLDWFAKRFAGSRGDSMADVAWWIIRNPIATLEDLATYHNVFVVVSLVLTAGGLCLLASRWMLLALPALAHNLLSAHPEQHMLRYHYWFPVILGLAIAGAVGAPRITAIRLAASRRLLVGWVGVSCFVLFAVGILYASSFTGWTEEKRVNLGGPEARRDALGLIPDGAPVAASVRLTPHLSQRREIYTLPRPFLPVDYGGDLTAAELEDRARRVRYVALDTDDSPKEYRATGRVLPLVLERRGFQEIARYGSVRIYVRPESS
jgi:uncharacterized membrane protein